MKFNLETVKAALITTGTVLAVVWVIRRTAIGQTVVAKALAG